MPTDHHHHYVGEEDWPQTAKTCRDRLVSENAALLNELADRPRQMRFAPDFTPLEGTHVFIQWKGTDACLDFTCECGRGGHFDGDFAYSLRCGCGKVWDMPHSFALIPQQNFESAGPQNVEMDEL